MEYGELMSLAEANLKAKGIMENYRMVGNLAREGSVTNFVGRFNLRYFERYGFKFRMIDSLRLPRKRSSSIGNLKPRFSVLPFPV